MNRPKHHPSSRRTAAAPSGHEQNVPDAGSGPHARERFLGDLDLHLIAEGKHANLADCLGAHAMSIDGVPGVRFAVWAPNAKRVAVVGDFNAWDGQHHPMRRRSAGVWEIFIPALQAGTLYKFELHDSNGALLPLKADPLARQTETPPATASVVAAPNDFIWTDNPWLNERRLKQAPEAPIAIYEVHIGSWLWNKKNNCSIWEDIGNRLIDYARNMGFTHLELMPVMEYPFGGSWGYQPLSLFAPTARYGSPADFARFVDHCHQAGLGIILDWVPAHFPSDTHGLSHFDGTALYEHADPRQGFHPDWNTLIYNLGRTEVRNFLIASALEWLRRYHIDGLRVDAVASMLYLDYSREEGQWIPNRHGGRENLEAVEFLCELNTIVREQCPGVIMIAEESTAWPGVTKPVAEGGLGFHYKWNMGWMHDTLRYMQHDPVHRRFHHNDLTFGMIYAYSERFILPLSHDEVVHGKGSLAGKMRGDRWQRFANLRTYFSFMWGHPGKKLIFMGAEFGQEHEWNHDAQLDWAALSDPLHGGLQNLVRDLNGLYRAWSALHASDSNPAGFSWLIGDDQDNSVIAFLRRHQDQTVLVVCNFTPVPRYAYRIGVPRAGCWLEKLNTDAAVYGGSNVGNAGSLQAQATPAHGQNHSLSLTLPPLAALMLQPEG